MRVGSPASRGRTCRSRAGCGRSRSIAASHASGPPRSAIPFADIGPAGLLGFKKLTSQFMTERDDPSGIGSTRGRRCRAAYRSRGPERTPSASRGCDVAVCGATGVPVVHRRRRVCGGWVSKGAFYVYFDQKQDLLLALLEDDAAGMDALMEDLAAGRHGWSGAAPPVRARDARTRRRSGALPGRERICGPRCPRTPSCAERLPRSCVDVDASLRRWIEESDRAGELVDDPRQRAGRDPAGPWRRVDAARGPRPGRIPLGRTSGGRSTRSSRGSSRREAMRPRARGRETDRRDPDCSGASSARLRRAGYLRKWLVLGVVIGVVAGLGAIVFTAGASMGDRASSSGSSAATRRPPRSARARRSAPARTSPDPWAIPLVVGLGRPDLGHPRLQSGSGGRGPRDRRRHRRRAPQPEGDPGARLVREDRGLGDHDRLRRLGGREGPTAQISAGFGSMLGAMARPHSRGREDRGDGRHRLWHRRDLPGAARRRDPRRGGAVPGGRRGRRADPVADRVDRRLRRVRRRRGVHADLRQARAATTSRTRPSSSTTR